MSDIEYRQFDNPNDLPAVVIKFRLGDKDALIRTDTVKYSDGSEWLKVEIVSIKTDTEIEAVLVDPLTQQEINYLADLEQADTSMNDLYNTMIIQLEFMENLQSLDLPTALQAIQTLATIQKRTLKYIRKNV